jgi:hypothetical protein
MATTQNTFTGNGSNLGPFSFTFKWLESTDIYVSVAGVLKTAGTHYNLQNLNYSTRTGGEVLFTAGNAPANGAEIRVYRQTDDTGLVATFYPGSAIRSQDLNDNFSQSLYKVQENTNYSVQDVGSVTLNANYTFSGTVSGSTPTVGTHLATKAYVDGVALAGIADGDRGDITISSAGTVYSIDNGVVTEAKLSFTPLKSTDLGTTVQAYDADTVKTDVLPTFTVATRTTERTITSGAFDLATGNLWTVGAITVPNPTNAVAGQTGAIRITAGPVVWSSNFKFPGGTAPTIATFPAVIPYYVSGSSTILMGNAVAGIA